MADEESTFDTYRRTRLALAMATIAHEEAMRRIAEWPRPDSPPDPAFRELIADRLEEALAAAADEVGECEFQFVIAWDAYNEEMAAEPDPTPEEIASMPRSWREAAGLPPASHLNCKLEVVK
jgi:hypothetical protein